MIKVGDLYEGEDGKTGVVYAVTGSTVSIDTKEPLGFPYPYGETRKLTFLHGEIPGEIRPAPKP